MRIPKHIDFLKFDLFLADFMTNSFRKNFFYSSHTMKIVKNQILPFQAKFGPKFQFYGPEWCFLVHTNPIDEKNRQKNFSLNKGAILLQHLPSRSDTHQALFRMVRSPVFCQVSGFCTSVCIKIILM